MLFKDGEFLLKPEKIKNILDSAQPSNSNTTLGIPILSLIFLVLLGIFSLLHPDPNAIFFGPLLVGFMQANLGQTNKGQDPFNSLINLLGPEGAIKLLDIIIEEEIWQAEFERLIEELIIREEELPRARRTLNIENNRPKGKKDTRKIKAIEDKIGKLSDLINETKETIAKICQENVGRAQLYVDRKLRHAETERHRIAQMFLAEAVEIETKKAKDDLQQKIQRLKGLIAGKATKGKERRYEGQELIAIFSEYPEAYLDVIHEFKPEQKLFQMLIAIAVNNVVSIEDQSKYMPVLEIIYGLSPAYLRRVYRNKKLGEKEALRKAIFKFILSIAEVDIDTLIDYLKTEKEFIVNQLADNDKFEAFLGLGDKMFFSKGERANNFCLISKEAVQQDMSKARRLASAVSLETQQAFRNTVFAYVVVNVKGLFLQMIKQERQEEIVVTYEALLKAYNVYVTKKKPEIIKGFDQRIAEVTDYFVDLLYESRTTNLPEEGKKLAAFMRRLNKEGYLKGSVFSFEEEFNKFQNFPEEELRQKLEEGGISAKDKLAISYHLAIIWTQGLKRGENINTIIENALPESAEPEISILLLWALMRVRSQKQEVYINKALKEKINRILSNIVSAQHLNERALRESLLMLPLLIQAHAIEMVYRSIIGLATTGKFITTQEARKVKEPQEEILGKIKSALEEVSGSALIQQDAFSRKLIEDAQWVANLNPENRGLAVGAILAPFSQSRPSLDAIVQYYTATMPQIRQKLNPLNNLRNLPPKGSIGNVFRILSEQEEPLTRQQIAEMAECAVRTIEPDLVALVDNLQLIEKIGKGKTATYAITEEARKNKKRIQVILNKLPAKPTQEQLANAVEEIKKIISNNNSKRLVSESRKKEERKTVHPAPVRKSRVYLKGIFSPVVHIVLSLAILLGSSYILALSFIGELNTLALSAVIFIGGTGVLVGLFYSVENIRRIFEHKPAKFYFGVGREIKRLTFKERLTLTQLADKAYLEERARIQPSFFRNIVNIFTVKGIIKRFILIAICALVALSLPHSSNWFILYGALFGLIVPYLVSVTYNFFCSYIDHYKFRAEFVRHYLEDKDTQDKFAGELSGVRLDPRFLIPIKGLWNSFTLRFPITAGIIVFALGRAQMVFWGSVVASALLPFVGVEIAGTSILESLAGFFGFVMGWGGGVEFCFKLIPIFNDWNLPHTWGDFIRLGIIVYGLRMLSLPYQIKTFKLRSLPLILINWLLAPMILSALIIGLSVSFFIIAPAVLLIIVYLFLIFRRVNFVIARYNFSQFWISFLHLWIVISIIGVQIGMVLMGQELLSRQPQSDIIDRPLYKTVQSLEGKPGVFAWGDYMINNITRITRIDFPQEIHNFLGGRKDVDTYNKVYNLYYQMKFEPSSISLSEISEDELGFILKNVKMVKPEDDLENINGIRRFSAFLLGEKGTQRAREILVRVLDDEDKEVRTIVAVSLGKMGDYKAAEPLIKYVEEEDPYLLSEESIAALLAINGPQATDAFIQGLQSDKEIVRVVSTLWLSQVGDSQAVQPLIEAMGKETQRFDITKLDKIESIKDMTPVQAEVIALAGINNPDSIESLVVTSISDKNISSREAAIGVLGLMGDPRAIEPLIDIATKSKDYSVRKAAAIALGNFNTPEAKEALHSILREKYEDWDISIKQQNIELRLEIASSLIKQGDDLQEFIPYFISIVEADRNSYYASRAISILGKIKDPQVSVYLLSFLQNKDSPQNIPAYIVRALGDRKELQAREPLISILNNNSRIPLDDLQKAVIYALVEIGDNRVIPLISKSLFYQASNIETQKSAIIALGELKDSSGIESLKRFLERPRKFSEPRSDSDFKMDSLAISSLNQIDPQKAEQILLDLLPKNGDIQFRQAAISGLVDSDSPKVTELMIASLKDNDPQVHSLAVSALTSKTTQSEVKEAFIDLLKYDHDPAIRSQVAINLGGNDDAEVREALKSALADPHPQVKEAAILSLTPQADSETMERIKPLLSDPNPKVRQAAILSLGLRLDDFPENVEFLTPGLKDDNPQIQEASVAVLGAKIDKFPQVKSAFLDIAKDESQPVSLRQTAVLSLSKEDDPEIKKVIIDNLDNPDWRMRQAAVLGLGNSKDAETPVLLKPLTQDPSWQVKQAVAKSLGNFDSPQARDNLEALSNDEYWQVRLAAVDSLGKSDDSQTADSLIPKSKDPSWQVRESVVSSLGNSNTPEATDALASSLNDPQLEVRRAGILAAATKFKTHPELKEPIMNRARDIREDSWVRSIAAASLEDGEYVGELDLEGIKSLKRTFVISMPGFDNPNPFDTGRPQGESWSKKDKIGQDFAMLERLGLGYAVEFNWSGNPQDFFELGEKFKNDVKGYYDLARALKMDTVLFEGHSAGGLYSDKGVSYFKTLDEQYIKKNPGQKRIIINILIGGSPLMKNDELFYKIARSTGGQYIPFWSLVDPLSWPSAFSPNSQMIFGLHGDYRNDLNYRQTGFSMVTGVTVPIRYTYVSYGTFPYQSNFLRMLQGSNLSIMGWGRIVTNPWSGYQSYPQIPSFSPWGSGSQFKYNYPSNWQSPSSGFRQNQYNFPKWPTNYDPRYNRP